MSQFTFDASTVAPQAAPEPVPAGQYKAAISEAEIEPTKTPGGQMLKLAWTVLDGQYVGRKVFVRLNIVNQNQQAVEIAYGELSAICRAIGQIRVDQTSELLGKPCVIDVEVRPAEGTYGPQNKIKRYHSLSGVPLEQIGGMPAGAGPTQPAWAQGAPVIGAAAGPGNAQAPVTPAAPTTVERLTAKAGSATIEQFVAQGWTKEQMVQQGYLEVIQAPLPAPPVTSMPAPPLPPPAAPPAPPAAPGAWNPPPAATAPATGAKPPWMQ